MRNLELETWLLQGDISIQYQAMRDLQGFDNPDLQARISIEGWGKAFLSRWHPDPPGWGEDFYQPNWISTHYTLLDLRNLNLSPENEIARNTLHYVLNSGMAKDGGIPLGPSTRDRSDVCVNGMFLNYASYFRMPEKELESVVDSILCEVMPDGGFNCRSNRSGAVHSSMHSTISVLEGLCEFQKRGFDYRKNEIQKSIQTSEEFLLMHRLYKSDRTGKIIHKDFLKLAYPCRWKYDILRALDYFQHAKKKWDPRMSDAMEALIKKRNPDGTWNMQAAHAGQQHFLLEKAGKPGRFNTLRALRVLKHFGA